MADLEKFLHAEGSSHSVLIQAGLAHVQFETIHPFLDGNGRVGRLLITLLLCRALVIREPILYLSLYFKQHRSAYYDHLDSVRQTGDWEAWLMFFLAGIQETAEGAVRTARNLVDLFQRDRALIQEKGRAAGSAIRVHDALKERPLRTINEICRHTELSFPAASSAMNLLGELGIAGEITGRKRNRIFSYAAYLDVLSEGTEPL